MLGEANTKYQNVQGEPSKAEEAELSKPTATVKGCFSTIAGLEAEEPPLPPCMHLTVFHLETLSGSMQMNNGEERKETAEERVFSGFGNQG